MRKAVTLMVTFLGCCIAHNKFNRCINNILKMYNGSSFVYLIKEEDFSIEMPQTKTVFTANFKSETNTRVPVRPDFYLIQISSVYNIRQLDEFLSKIYFDYNWNSEAQVLIINSHTISSLVLFELTWKFYFRDVLIVAGNLGLFTYHPISWNCSAYCGEYLGKCSDIFKIGEVKEQTRKLEGCIFRDSGLTLPPFGFDVTSKEYPGVFQHFLNTLASLMKYEFGKFGHYSGFGVILGNGTFTQYIGELKEGNVDYIIGINVNDTYLKYFEVVPMYFYLDYYFWAPIAKEADVWVNLAMVFSWIIWALIVASFSAVVCCSYVLSGREVGQFRNFDYCTLSLWRATFGDCSTLPQSIRFKFLTIIWTLATFILCSAFQSYITSVMFVPRYNGQINSIKTLLDSKLPIGGSYFPKEFLRNANTEVSTQLLQNYQMCSLLMDCVVRTAQKRDMVALKDTRVVMYIWSRLLENGEPMLYWFYNDIKLLNAIQMRKGHPLKNPTSRFSMRCLETGLNQKWDPYNIVPERTSRDTKYNYMSLDHLLIPFLLLIIGSVLATIRFLYECLFKRHSFLIM